MALLSHLLCHLRLQAPGNFAAAMAPAGSTAFHPVGVTLDTSAPSLSLYYIDAKIPADVAPGNYTLQLAYNTKNSQAPPAFYACADITVIASPSA